MMRIPSTNRMDVPAAFLKFSKVTKPHSGRYTVGHWESETLGQLIYCAYIRCSDSRQQRFFVKEQVEVMAIFETNNFGIEGGSAIFLEAS